MWRGCWEGKPRGKHLARRWGQVRWQGLSGGWHEVRWQGHAGCIRLTWCWGQLCRQGSSCGGRECEARRKGLARSWGYIRWQGLTRGGYQVMGEGHTWSIGLARGRGELRWKRVPRKAREGVPRREGLPWTRGYVWWHCLAWRWDQIVRQCDTRSVRFTGCWSKVGWYGVSRRGRVGESWREGLSWSWSYV